MPGSKKMVRFLLGSGENNADIRYASGLSTPDDFLFFSCRDEKIAVLSALEFSRGRKQAKPGVAVWRDDECGGPEISGVLKEIAKHFGCGSFEVPRDFPLYEAERMRASGMEVTTGEAVFFPEREHKSRAEVALICLSQRAAEAGLARAVDVLRESEIAQDGTLLWEGRELTSEILRGEIDGTMLKLGMLPSGTICAGGPQGALPHNTGSGVLRANTPIVMDIFPRSAKSGYWGDLTRTVVRGKASDVVKRAYAAVLEARETGKSLIRIGADKPEVHRAAAAVLERHGFHTGKMDGQDFGFFHGLGHGVGLEIHEAPRLSPRASGKLTGGEVVTVEPGLYYPEWGGIRLEDLVYLPCDGPAECLTKAPDFLEIP